MDKGVQISVTTILHTNTERAHHDTYPILGFLFLEKYLPVIFTIFGWVAEP
jgi:hypothetical protein